MNRRVYRLFAGIGAVILGFGSIWLGFGLWAQQVQTDLFSEPFCYGDNGEVVTLTVSPDRFGVRFNREMSASELASFITAQGLYNPLGPGESFETVRTQDIGVFYTDRALSPADALETIEAVPDHPSVETVFPVFFLDGDTRHPSMLTDMVSIVVPAGTEGGILDRIDDDRAEPVWVSDYPAIRKVGIRVRVTSATRNLTGEDTLAFANRYANQRGVLEATPDFMPLYQTLTALPAPNDGLYTEDNGIDVRWYFEKMEVREAWEQLYPDWPTVDDIIDGANFATSNRVTIAVLDQGAFLRYEGFDDYPAPFNTIPDPDSSAYRLTRFGSPVFPFDLTGHGDIVVKGASPNVGGQYFNMAEVMGMPGVDDDMNGYMDDYFGWDHVGGDPAVFTGGDPIPFPDPFDNEVVEDPGIRGHGTAAAGRIAAIADNDEPPLTLDPDVTQPVESIPGLCPTCTVMPLRYHAQSFNNLDPGGDETDVFHVGRAELAVAYAAGDINSSTGNEDMRPRARIIAAMAGVRNYDAMFHAAVQDARARGCVIIAPAGNMGESLDANPIFPAAWPEVIAVGASDFNPGGDPEEFRSVFSNFSWTVDFTAPVPPGGANAVWSTLIDETAGEYTWGTGTGTSAAMPTAAGVTGLVLSERPELSPMEVQIIVQLTADDLTGTSPNGDVATVGRDYYTGYGRLNANRAVAMARAIKCYLTIPDPRYPDGKHRILSVTPDVTAGDDEGHVIFDGRIFENATSQLSSDGGGEILIKKGAEVVARIDFDAKALYLKGTITEQTTIPVAVADAASLKIGTEKAGSPGWDAVITADGDLLAQGRVFAINTNDKVPGSFHRAETVQEVLDALAAAQDSHIIEIAPGKYEFSQPLNFANKNIVIRSEDPADPTVAEATVLTVTGQQRVVVFGGDETNSAALMGFTIEGGGPGSNNGGIAGNTTEASILFNRFIDNDTNGDGGAISDADGMIAFNAFGEVGSETASGGNSALNGGALAHCDGVVVQNMLRYNLADGLGGAIHASTAFIRSNYIGNNTADNGGALSVCDGVIRSNIMWENMAELDGGALFDCGIATGPSLIEHNTIYDNHAGDEGGAMMLCNPPAGFNRNNILWANTDTAGGDAQFRSSTTPAFSAIGQTANPGGTGNIGPFDANQTSLADIAFVTTTLTFNGVGQLPSHDWGSFLHIRYEPNDQPPVVSVCFNAGDDDEDNLEYRDIDDQAGPLIQVPGEEVPTFRHDIGADEVPTPVSTDPNEEDPVPFSFWWERF